MRTQEEQIALLEHLLDIARRRKEAGETEWLEFKTNISESHSSITYEGVGKYISGISNVACLKDKAYGYLVLGIQDSTWDIVGTNLRMAEAKISNQDYELWLRKNLSPMISFEIEEFDYNGNHIVMFIIPATNSEPVNFKGEAYLRVGSNLTKLKDFPDYIRKIYHSQNDWSGEIIDEATFDDLDPEAIAKAREWYANKHEHLREEMKTWDDVTFLNKARITKKGKITNTAILLLGKPESEHLISPAIARIRWILKDSNGNERDYSIETCPFVLAVSRIFSKIRNLKYRYMNPALLELVPDELETYDPFTIREALNNAIAHQDYSYHGMINVIEHEDRLIFSNVGGFIPDNIHNVLQNDAPEERYRNPFLVGAMVELKMVDTIGSGIRRMFNLQKQRFFPMPDYDFSDNKVKLTIVSKVLDMDYAALLAKDHSLNLMEMELLSRIQMHRNLTDYEIAYLRKRKLVEGRKNALYVAKTVASNIGKKADYTKNKGLDDKYYKDLLSKFIKQHKKVSRKDVDELLLTKLPEALTEKQKITKIGHLLSALKKAGVIRLGEKKMWEYIGGE
ncbi:MAG: putative DNA binding domain-containing protein [Bacteroidales bacterium]|jgi:ATP-dependent DNA helicase RecG|nr:putative DNA binding domain-containing protein [Bacteroidales bacterium]